MFEQEQEPVPCQGDEAATTEEAVRSHMQKPCRLRLVYVQFAWATYGHVKV